MHESPLRELIEKNFVNVKIDTGNWDKNTDIAKSYGNVIDKGIPSIVVVDQDNNILMNTLTGQLANARHMGKQELYNFFVSVVSRAKSVANKLSHQ